jgi:Transketolase, C-terminal domain
VLILVGLEPERLVAIVESRGSLRKYQKSLDEITHQLGHAGYLETVRRPALGEATGPDCGATVSEVVQVFSSRRIFGYPMMVRRVCWPQLPDSKWSSGLPCAGLRREEEHLIPLGVADVKRQGSDITLIAHGRALITYMKAAELLATEYEINVEVVDLRLHSPAERRYDLGFRLENPSRVVLEESKPFCNMGAQIAALLQEKIFDELDAPGA